MKKDLNGFQTSTSFLTMQTLDIIFVFIFILLRKWDTYGEFNHERVNNTSDHSDKVKSIPVVFEVALEKKKNGNN